MVEKKLIFARGNVVSKSQDRSSTYRTLCRLKYSDWSVVHVMSCKTSMVQCPLTKTRNMANLTQLAN